VLENAFRQTAGRPFLQGRERLAMFLNLELVGDQLRK